MRLQFGTSSYERAEGDLPELPVINMYAEEAPTEEGGIVLQSRPGLADRGINMGAGPVRGLYQADGVLDGLLYGVSGDKMYEGAAEVGDVDGAGPVSWGGYEDTLFMAAGGSLWGYDSAALAAVAFPDGASVAAITVGASRLIAIRADTQTFYWSSPLGTTIGALDFASAESSPDRLRDVLFLDDTLILFGAETVEFWPNTGSADLPFQPLQGRVIEKGIKKTGACCALGASFAWVTNENNVCIQSEQNVISNPGLQSKIEVSTECLLFTVLIDGTEFLALRLDGETQLYSTRSGKWSEFASYGLDNWIVQCAAGPVMGSAQDGSTLAWGTGHQDLGGVLERRFRAGAPLNSGGVIVSNMQVRTNVGQTPFLTGDYANPVLEMRLSRDVGQTWGSWRSASLGEQGKYRTKVQWRACGMASNPGLFAEFRCADPVPLRISDVLMNEPWGGRG